MTKYEPTQLMIDWISALREPGRKQTSGTLGRINNGEVSNCCLGVLVELTGHTSITVNPGGQDRLMYSGPLGNGMVSLPSLAVIDQLMGYMENSRDDVPLGHCRDRIITASVLNDAYHWTFLQIADQAEKVYVNGTGSAKDYPLDLPDIVD